jgi:hypothetical protein
MVDLFHAPDPDPMVLRICGPLGSDAPRIQVTTRLRMHERRHLTDWQASGSQTSVNHESMVILSRRRSSPWSQPTSSCPTLAQNRDEI